MLIVVVAAAKSICDLSSHGRRPREGRSYAQRHQVLSKAVLGFHVERASHCLQTLEPNVFFFAISLLQVSVMVSTKIFRSREPHYSYTQTSANRLHWRRETWCTWHYPSGGSSGIRRGDTHMRVVGAEQLVALPYMK